MTQERAAPQAPNDSAVETGQPDADHNRVRRDLRQAGVTAVSLAAAGVPLGALWAAVAPRPDPAAVLAGAETALTAQMGADVSFMVITAVAGAVAGVLAWRFVREPSWLAPVALSLGGGVGALVAAAVGAAVNSTVPGLAGLAERAGGDLPTLEELLGFGVRARAVYFAFPLAALVVFLVLSYVAGDRHARRAPAAPAAAPQDQEPAAAG